MNEVQRLILHYLLEEASSQSTKTRRNITSGMHQARHNLLITTTRRKVLELPTIGILRYVISTGRDSVLRIITRRRFYLEDYYWEKQAMLHKL